MGNYFKPLRRKLGVAILLLACASTVAWVRSLMVEDFLGNSWFSRNGVIEQVFTMYEVPLVSLVKDEHGNLIDVTPKTEAPSASTSNSGAGLPTTNSSSNPTEVTEWSIPYWGITLPLISLSVWLLFFSAPKSKPGLLPQNDGFANT